MSRGTVDHSFLHEKADSSIIGESKPRVPRETVLEETLDLPFLTMNAVPSRLRRRSDQPSSTTLVGQPAFDVNQAPFEIPAVPSQMLITERSRRWSEAPRDVDEGIMNAPSKDVKFDTLPPSYPITPDTSVRTEQFEVEDSPAVSPAERARHKKNGWLHFGAVCWMYWLIGQSVPSVE